MTIFKKLACLAPIIILSSALAQSGRFCMAGDLEHMTPAQLQACRSDVEQVREAASKYQLPFWHFVVVCDEQGWKDYAALSQASTSVLQHATADTNVSMRTTFFRGSRLDQQVGQRLLAVEMASIIRRQASQQIAANQ